MRASAANPALRAEATLAASNVGVDTTQDQFVDLLENPSPVVRSAALQAFEGFVQGRDLVSERNLRNHAARKLTSERVSGQKPLAGVGQRFPRPIDSTTIRGDESVALGQIGGDGQSRNACGCGKAGGHKLAT